MMASRPDERLAPGPACISVVLPVFNESAVLAELRARIGEALKAGGWQYELIFVNDGSSDATRTTLDAMAATDPVVRVLHLSRNFGQQAAVQAGLAHARGDAVIVMDSDLQDDPAALPAFLERWREGFQVVFAVRTARKESWWKRFLFHSFYRLLQAVSRVPIPTDAGNFGLVDGVVARQIVALADRDRYFPGLRSWVGYRQIGVPVARGARHDAQPRVSLAGLVRLAKSALFSFSTVPLTVFYLIAALSLLVAVGLSAFVLYHRLFTGLAIAGWTSILITACFFGALNALGIGILGEYVIRIYDQVRGRPLYLVAERVNFDSSRGTSDRDETHEDAAAAPPDRTASVLPHSVAPPPPTSASGP